VHELVYSIFGEVEYIIMEEEALEAFLRAVQGTETDFGRSKGLAFIPREHDVFIVSPPKCGTTLVQQVTISV
jgi:hypothetical protein